jgi:hypothetical protein
MSVTINTRHTAATVQKGGRAYKAGGHYGTGRAIVHFSGPQVEFQVRVSGDEGDGSFGFVITREALAKLLAELSGENINATGSAA